MTDTNTENEVKIPSDKRDWFANHSMTMEEREEFLREKIDRIKLYQFRSENVFHYD